MACLGNCGNTCGHYHQDEGWSWFWFVFIFFTFILIFSIPYGYYKRSDYCGDEPCPARYGKRPARLKED